MGLRGAGPVLRRSLSARYQAARLACSHDSEAGSRRMPRPVSEVVQGQILNEPVPIVSVRRAE